MYDQPFLLGYGYICRYKQNENFYKIWMSNPPPKKTKSQKETKQKKKQNKETK